MAYYCMCLLEKNKEILTIIVPWGKFLYQALPMGVSIATDIVQECMLRILSDIECIIVYIDDIIIIGLGTLAEHLKEVNKILIRLQEYGMQVNPTKSSWAKDQLEYLGFTMSRNGNEPQKKKNEAILRTAPPNNQKQ
eukprot:2301728-Ditylum_brightwellii.AAC.1